MKFTLFSGKENKSLYGDLPVQSQIPNKVNKSSNGPQKRNAESASLPSPKGDNYSKIKFSGKNITLKCLVKDHLKTTTGSYAKERLNSDGQQFYHY
jgi:hypothetical protein